MNHTTSKAILRSLAVAMAMQFAVGGSVMPFLGIYFEDRGLALSEISVVFAGGSAMLLVFPFLWGMLADRFIPLNRMFTCLNLLTFLALMVIATQGGFWGLMLGTMGLYACFNPTLILINPLCFQNLDKPREQFGLLRAWGSLGWMIPSLPIGVVLAMRDPEQAGSSSVEFAMWLGMGLSLAMAVMSFWLPHSEPGAGGKPSEGTTRVGYWTAMKRLLGNPSYVTVLAAFFLMAGSFSIFVLYSPLHLVRLGMDRAWIGPVQCVGVLLEVILFRWRTLFVHRWSYATTICMGCLCLILRQVLFATVDNLWVLTSTYLLAGMVIVFFHIGASVLANALAGPEVRSTAQTLLVLCGPGLGPLFANVVVNAMTRGDRDDLTGVFLFAAGLAAVAGCLIVWRGRRLDADALMEPGG